MPIDRDWLNGNSPMLKSNGRRQKSALAAMTGNGSATLNSWCFKSTLFKKQSLKTLLLWRGSRARRTPSKISLSATLTLRLLNSGLTRQKPALARWTRGTSRKHKIGPRASPRRSKRDSTAFCARCWMTWLRRRAKPTRNSRRSLNNSLFRRTR